MDTGRRTFRGRGGPTDRRLPKHQARRRKQPPRNSSEEESNARQTNLEDNDDDLSHSLDRASDDNEECDNEGMDMIEQGPLIVSENPCDSLHDEVSAVNDDKENPAVQEIQHVMSRACNIQESIQLSSAAIVTPSIWKENVLNAVQNCVGEWRAILSHYPELDPVVCKAPSLAIFHLVQLSVQSGPLSGAKPGYFKRCGSDVARQASLFLISIVPDNDEAVFLRFSDKQRDVIAKWRNSAAKASEQEMPPSKSALKKQSKGQRKK